MQPIDSQAAPTAATTTTATALANIVHDALNKSPYLGTYLAENRFRIEAGEGQVKLHGEVGSYYEKQMAQETVLRIDGVERIENLLQVAWS